VLLLARPAAGARAPGDHRADACAGAARAGGAGARAGRLSRPGRPRAGPSSSTDRHHSKGGDALTHPIVGVPPPPPAARGLLAGLTPEQTAAVMHGSGPLMLLAGPGAGKTKTLTHRAAYLLATGSARPWEILAVTFSVRAAGELRLRLAD